MVTSLEPRGLAAGAVHRSHEQIDRDGRAGVWIELVDRSTAAARAEAIDAAVDRGEDLPLAGLTFAVKGNIDVAGLQTTAGCPTYGVLAIESAPVVRRLESAGAVVVGVTNLDQFATGLVGTRSPLAICPNAFWEGRISGGSSSGSAVAVATGQVDFALGTDTAGSGRVPAAANGIIGAKPTLGRIPTDGVVPACRSFDCVSVFGRDLTLVDLVVAVAAGEVPAGRGPGPDLSDRPVRLGVPRLDTLDFDGDVGARSRHASAVADVVAALGADVVELDLTPFLAAGALLYGGAFVVERYEAVGAFIDAHRADVDPVVGQIISSARDISPADLERDQIELARLRNLVAPTWATIDALLLPTVPRIPTVAEVAADPFGVNAMVGTFTAFVNLLDLCSLTLPVGSATSADPPASISFIAPAGADASLVALGRSLLPPVPHPHP